MLHTYFSWLCACMCTHIHPAIHPSIHACMHACMTRAWTSLSIFCMSLFFYTPRSVYIASVGLDGRMDGMYLSCFYISIRRSINPSIGQINQSINQSIYLSIYLSNLSNLSIYLSIYQSMHGYVSYTFLCMTICMTSASRTGPCCSFGTSFSCFKIPSRRLLDCT